MTKRMILTAPRWAGLSSAAKDLAWNMHLRIHVDVEKHFLTETIRIEVVGDGAIVSQFVDTLKYSIDEYNE